MTKIRLRFRFPFVPTKRTDGESQFVENRPTVGISPGGVSQSEESVVKERKDESAFSRQGQEEGRRKEKDFAAGDETEDLRLPRLDGVDETSYGRETSRTDTVEDAQSKGRGVE